MPTTLTDQELEQLNAYIDGELSTEELTRVEQRVASDPDWQSELEALQLTTAMLGQSEPLPVPRNFTLDPTIYGKTERQGFFNSMGWPALSVAGAFLAIVIVSGVLLIFRSTSGGDVMVAESSEVRGSSQEAIVEPAAEEGEISEEEAAEAEREATAPTPEKTEPAAGPLTEPSNMAPIPEAEMNEEMAEESFSEGEALDEEELAAEAGTAPQADEMPAAELEAGEMSFEESQGDFATGAPPVEQSEADLPPQAPAETERTLEQATPTSDQLQKEPEPQSVEDADEFPAAEEPPPTFELPLGIIVGIVALLTIVIGAVFMLRRSSSGDMS